MIEFLVELGLAIELVFYGGGEFLVEGVARLIGAPFGRRGRSIRSSPALACCARRDARRGLYWVWPYRIVASGPYPGISLLISPVVNGLLTDALGTWRDEPRSAAHLPVDVLGRRAVRLRHGRVRFWLMGAR